MFSKCGAGEDSWTVRWSNQSILKETSPEYSLKGLTLMLKLQYLGHLMQRTDSLEKTLMLGKIVGRGEGDERGWDGWMASLTQWMSVWTNSGGQWRTGKPGVLQSMGMQNWTQFHNWTTVTTSPERRSNIGRQPSRDNDGEDRLYFNCWHVNSYLLPNDIYTAERSVSFMFLLNRSWSHSQEKGLKWNAYVLQYPKWVSHPQILKPLNTTTLAKLAGSFLASALIRI